uniref:Large ribosomal subunit protein bL35c n=1 Tax=Scinaia undulata TaxID=1884664 RepID=A0A1G4NY34_9FLOR|nr:Ribosomal protein L35 [Scinaia undulata]SCW23409.1 Ribosomal protein L35 [Scinaia undulata]
MTKIKTSSSIAKRFKKTGSGKLLRHKACRSHLLEKKSQKRKKSLSKVILVNSRDAKRIVQKLYC